MILYHDDLLFIIIIVPTVPWRGFQSRQPFALRFTPILTPLLVPTQTLGEHGFLHRKTLTTWCIQTQDSLVVRQQC